MDTTAQNYQYVSARFLARVIGSPGACAGMFTYLANADLQKVQEADIEILTSDHEIWYNTRTSRVMLRMEA